MHSPWAIAVLLVLCSTARGAAAPASVAGADSRTAAPVHVPLIGPESAAKATVVVFLSARCPCSASHEAALTALYKDYSTKGFRFIGIHSNSDEPPELSKLHFNASALPFPVVEDEGARLADLFGALKTPHVYVVSPQGEFLYQGGVDDSHNAATAKAFYLKNALLAVADGRKPEPSEARTLGCAIKRP